MHNLSLFPDKQPHIALAPPAHIVEAPKLKTIDDLREEQKAKRQQLEDKAAEKIKADKKLQEQVDEAPTTPVGEKLSEPQELEDIEAEAGQQGAFNEETGEINWDCPCLGGMAHGPW